MTILPGATLGMLGGGQLGRMFTVAARTMGYEVIVLDPDPASPAGQLASEHLRAAYQDPGALERLARQCAAVSTEFENVPAESLRALAEAGCVVRPSAEAVAVLQDRLHEKTFLRAHGLPTARFAAVRCAEDLADALQEVGTPALLKVSRFGYDGKGQARIATLEEARAAFRALRGETCVLEEWLAFERELSVVIARGADGAVAAYPVAENRHREGILDVSIAPARVPEAVAARAVDLARDIAARLDYVGVMAVEYFLLPGGELRINEVAPRPHNSGHFTLDACVTSQFVQQLRALCGLPLGDTRLLSPVVMVNLLGDLWEQGAPPWEAVLKHPNVKLHLYGKREPRRGRKMGHFNALHEDLAQALRLALDIKAELAHVPPGALSGGAR